MRGRYQGKREWSGRFFIEKYLNYSRKLCLVKLPHPWGRLSTGLCSTRIQSPWLAVAVLPLGKVDDMCISLSFPYQAVKVYCFCLFMRSSITMNDSRQNYSGQLKGWVKWQWVELFAPARDFPYDSNFILSPRRLFVIFASRELDHQSTKHGQSNEKKLQKPSNALQL